MIQSEFFLLFLCQYYLQKKFLIEQLPFFTFKNLSYHCRHGLQHITWGNFVYSISFCYISYIC